jgi:predicted MPP superfamily phosphohydrolase
MFIGTSSLLDYDTNILEAVKTEEDNQEYFKIWLNHEPTIMDELIDNDIHPNIILVGHTLGGLINTPFTSNILKQDGINNYTKNYYHKKKMSMYISNGLGTHKYNVRFLNPPSINLYRLYNN